jgi:ferrous iron transport protein A
VTLEEVHQGTRGVVRALAGGRSFVSRVAALGLVKGARFEMLHNSGRGPVLVLVRDTRVALGRGEAHKIEVEELDDDRAGNI